MKVPYFFFAELSAVNDKKKNSAMRTRVAYETELLFSDWCLIEFLLEGLIFDYS